MRKRRDFLSASAPMMDSRRRVGLPSESICGLTPTKYFMQNVKHAHCHKQAVFWNTAEPELKNDFNQNCKSPLSAAFIYVDWIEWHVIIPGLPRFPLFISHFLSFSRSLTLPCVEYRQEGGGHVERRPTHLSLNTLCVTLSSAGTRYLTTPAFYMRGNSPPELASNSFSFKVHLISINLALVV